jgi:hypothetical protein
MVQSLKFGGSTAARSESEPYHRTASVRLGPLGTVWDRINFFLGAKTGEKIRFAVVVGGGTDTTCGGGPLGAA